MLIQNILFIVMYIIFWKVHTQTTIINMAVILLSIHIKASRTKRFYLIHLKLL